MSECIVFKTANRVGVIHPMPEYRDADGNLFEMTLEQVAEKDVPAGCPWRIVDIEALPKSRNWRDAWTDDLPTDTVDVSLDLARDAHRALIVRKALERIKPDEFGRRDFSEVESQLNALPIQSVVSLEELYNLWPHCIDARSSRRAYRMHE